MCQIFEDGQINIYWILLACSYLFLTTKETTKYFHKKFPTLNHNKLCERLSEIKRKFSCKDYLYALVYGVFSFYIEIISPLLNLSVVSFANLLDVWDMGANLKDEYVNQNESIRILALSI